MSTMDTQQRTQVCMHTVSTFQLQDSNSVNTVTYEYQQQTDTYTTHTHKPNHHTHHHTHIHIPSHRNHMHTHTHYIQHTHTHKYIQTPHRYISHNTHTKPCAHLFPLQQIHKLVDVFMRNAVDNLAVVTDQFHHHVGCIQSNLALRQSQCTTQSHLSSSFSSV